MTPKTLTTVGDLFGTSRVRLQDREKAHVEPQDTLVFAILSDYILETLVDSVLTELR